MKKIKCSKNLKKGSYSLTLTVIVIAIVVVVNLILAKLPLKYREVDLSERKLTNIGETTEEILGNLEEEITIYQITDDGNTDQTITKLLEKYQELNSHIKVETLDPVTHPAVVKEYTSQSLSDNSLIVVGENRSKVVEYDDIYEYSMDYYTYSYSVTGFDGEGQITSAIAYVTSESLPIMYVMTGHAESDMTSVMTDAIEKENIEIQDLNLVTAESVPEDAGCVMLLSPSNDISSEEAEKLITYLEQGGKVFLVTAYSDTEMPNIQKVLNNYGMKTMDGLVLEGNANYYASGNPTFLVPELGSSEAIRQMSGQNVFVLVPYAQAIEELEDKRDTISIESLLVTSGDAYIKTDLTGTIEKNGEDLSGTFTLAAAATETVDEEETKLVYLASESLFNDQVNAMVSGNNVSFFANIVSWMCDHEQSVSIPSKSTELSYLAVTAATSRLWGAVTVAVIPGAILLYGGVVWFKRRKK